MKKIIKVTAWLIVAALLFAGVQIYQFGQQQVTSFSVLLSTLFGVQGEQLTASDIRSKLKVEQGWFVNTYAAGVDNARFMHMNEQGYLLITQPRSGTVLALHPDTDGDGVSDGRHVVIDGLNRPHGVDVHEGWLYIGESDAIGRVRLTAQAELAGDYERLLSGLGDEGHWTKTVRIGPDGWLYFNSGSSCNVCLEEDSMRATMQRMQTDGKQLETVAGGLRNTVGFDWAPWDQALYGTDNGRDLLGDDYPPCELNLIENGAFYGWPYRNAANDGDPDFGEQMPQNLQPLAPVYEFAAHNAPLGMRFLRHQAGAERSALVALHGSWNRSEADGYKVLRLRWDERGDISGQDFLAGFIQADGILGRPVDIVESRQGEVFVSDDYTGVVYRVSRSAESADATAESQAQATDFEIDATLAAQGAQLYAQHNCVQCHADGEGLRPLRGLSAQSPAQLRASLLTPVPPMPRLPLSEQEQTALVHYLRQQFP